MNACSFKITENMTSDTSEVSKIVAPEISDDPLYLFERVASKLRTLWMKATYPFASIGSQVAFHYSVDLRRSKADRIGIGNGVYLGKDVWLNVTLTSNSRGPAIVLGDRCVIGRRTQLSARNQIVLENDVTTGPGILIMDHNHAYEDITRPVEQQGVTEGGTVRIGEGSFLGFGAAIVCSKGELALGKHCVVAANAVVTRSFPDYCVISGNPARIVSQYDMEKKAWVLGGASSQPR
jgi:acetyltransferase-like isoleucine patch superfamily enzyme